MTTEKALTTTEYGIENRIGVTPEQKIDTWNKIINRPIDWNLFRKFQHTGKKVKCEICGNDDWWQHFCKPCIHRTWCCECCCILVIPNYATGMWILTNKESE